MVLYFRSNLTDPPAFIYVGKDKVESECSRRLWDVIDIERTVVQTRS